MKKVTIALAGLLLYTPLMLGGVQHHSIDTKELDCLARAVYSEARGESHEGRVAVAKTVLNRVNDPAFPKTICKVVYQPKQFSNINSLVIRDKNAWNTAMHVAYNVISLNGKYTFKAKYFHAVYVSPRWGKKPIAKIGKHIFYA